MGDASEDSVGAAAEGDQQVKEPVDGQGSTGRWEMWASSAGIPLVHGCGKAGTFSAKVRRRN